MEEQSHFGASAVDSPSTSDNFIDNLGKLQYKLETPCGGVVEQKVAVGCDNAGPISAHDDPRRDFQSPMRPLSELPLSEVASELRYVAVHDVASFATRSVADRENELSVTGKVKRPLNAFMLYRKAYQDVAKASCMGNNHQQISSVCGQSWRRETPRIQSVFRRLADQEKSLHMQAFPNYRYDPVQAKRQISDITPHGIHRYDHAPIEATRKPRTPRRRRQVGSGSVLIPARPMLKDDHNALKLETSSSFGDDESTSYSFPLFAAESDPCGIEADLYGGMPALAIPFHGNDLHAVQDQCIDPSLFSADPQCSLAADTGATRQHWSYSGDELSGGSIDYLRGVDTDWCMEELHGPERVESWFWEQ